MVPIASLEEFLKTHESITSSELAQLARCAERTARQDLSRLVAWNVVGVKKDGKITRYLLLPAFRHSPFRKETVPGKNRKPGGF